MAESLQRCSDSNNNIDAFHIRPASDEDVETIMGFVRELAEFEKLSHIVTATTKDLRDHLFGDPPIAYALLAELDGQPVGFALYWFGFSDFLGKPTLYLEDLYIQPQMRGRSFGTRLLRYLAKIAQQRKCGRFEWIVLDWNTKAITFYEALGAKIHREWLLCRMTEPEIALLAQAHADDQAQGSSSKD